MIECRNLHPIILFYSLLLLVPLSGPALIRLDPLPLHTEV